MDTATLFAFYATYPEILEEFMQEAAEHIILEGELVFRPQSVPTPEVSTSL